MYAELKIGNRFHRVALPEIEVNQLQELLLISYGHPHCWDVLYAVQGIQKLIPTLFCTESRRGFLGDEANSGATLN